jgi:hypothetical protein
LPGTLFGLLIEGAKRQYHRAMKPAVLIPATVLALAVLQFALADDFKTINGKEYKNAEVSRVEADGIVIRTKTGISKIYFIELPKDVQERYRPRPAKTPSITTRVWIELKSWATATANPTSFVLFFVGGASLIAAVVFAIVRSRLG